MGEFVSANKHLVQKPIDKIHNAITNLFASIKNRILLSHLTKEG
jgi:hypothetical protein